MQNKVSQTIKLWGKELGFAAIGITDHDLQADIAHFNSWVKAGYHGTMQYLAKYAHLRSEANLLLPNTKSVICCLMSYPALPTKTLPGYIAAYAYGRDYHKIMRQRLLKLASRISREVKQCNYRVFCDSAPVLEKALAIKAGLGWLGKNNLIINNEIGSYSFLGEIYLDLPLMPDHQVAGRCGNCQRCLNYCPTNALISPYKIDAERCISYLTIEYRGIIPEELRSLIGNKIFGCDDCQKICPWNRFATKASASIKQFQERFINLNLVDLFLWDEQLFLEKTQGTALRRIPYDCWLRNLAIALGNQPRNEKTIATLKARSNYPSSLVQEHVRWGLAKIQGPY